MTSLLKKTSSLLFPAFLLIIVYVVVSSLSIVLDGWSITALNVVSGIVAITLGSGVVVVGAMADDSGKGGFFVHTLQWMSLSYPLAYLIGLVGSIAVVNSEFENRQQTATALASMSLVWLGLIVVVVLAALAVESVKDSSRRRESEREIERQKIPYLIHLPHYGTVIPDEYAGDYLLDKERLAQNVIAYADLYTDELFAPLFERFGGVKNVYSRLFFDPERFFEDEQEGMSRIGLGWFYENAILERVPLRKTKNKEPIAEYYRQHHHQLNQLTQAKLDLYGHCTILDCHSFSNERYWFHDQDVELPDICIGYDEEHVDMALVEILKEGFQSYNVAINSPYAGSLVPTAFYRKNKNVRSVMIEVNGSSPDRVGSLYFSTPCG